MAQAAKTNQTKKLEVVKEIQQLGIKAQNLEHEKSTHIYNKRGEFHQDFSQLQEAEQKLTQQRKAELVRITQQINKIKGLVNRFHRELKDVKPTPDFVEKIKCFMEEIESHMSTFKSQSREQYEELMKEERFTQQEVIAFENKFDSWSHQLSTPLLTKGNKVGPLPSHHDVRHNLPPEVEEFAAFLDQNGGVRGGWDDYDHGTFLKFRNRYQGRHVFLRELVRMLPTRTDQEIRDHERWYQQYLNMNDRKKEAIQKWKERRENEKEALTAHADSSDSADDDQMKQIQQQEAEKERRVKQVQLNRWKIEKELERAEAEEKKVRAKLEKAKQEEIQRQQQMEQKKKVEEYKQACQKEEEERKYAEAVQQQIEQEDRASYGKVIISQFQDRDMQSLHRRLGKNHQKQIAEQEKKARLQRLKQQVAVNVERDPSRLLQPTEGWKERQKNRGPEGTGPVLHMQHRAVPSWRQGMH